MEMNQQLAAELFKLAASKGGAEGLRHMAVRSMFGLHDTASFSPSSITAFGQVVLQAAHGICL
jgi:hypothetical protein